MTTTCHVYETTGVTNTVLWRLLVYARCSYDLICFIKVAHLLIKMSLLVQAGKYVFPLQSCSSSTHLSSHTLNHKKEESQFITGDGAISPLFPFCLINLNSWGHTAIDGEKHACNSANSKSPKNTKYQLAVSLICSTKQSWISRKYNSCKKVDKNTR